MIFTDRRQAGGLLAKKLLQEGVAADIVLGLARGGVVVSHAVANALHIPEDVLIVKKIGSPGNPELATGAVVPEGQSLNVSAKRVLLVDDGIATGETMKAAITWLQEHGPAKILVAVPVAPPDAVETLKTLVDSVICLEITADFGAVGEFYKNFPQITDEDVIKLLT